MRIVKWSWLLIIDQTDYVYLETPTNPLMVEFDIAKVSAIAHAKGAKVIVDNTFYSPIYQNPLELGADVVLHSATKYLSGHNDVLAGALMTNDQDWYDKLFYQSKHNWSNSFTTGFLIYSCVVWKLFRFEWSGRLENAQKIVAFLKKSPAVKQVYYTGKGGMISLKVVDESKIPHILNTLKIFTFAESLGGVESLITYPATQTHADIPVETRQFLRFDRLICFACLSVLRMRMIWLPTWK